VDAAAEAARIKQLTGSSPVIIARDPDARAEAARL